VSGKPNPHQIARVVLISRRLEFLRDDAIEVAGRIKRDQERLEQIGYAKRKLDEERTALMRAMDVDPSQQGNYGHELRFAEFLNMFATCTVEGAAEEPK
jgi:hypothetical protein